MYIEVVDSLLSPFTSRFDNIRYCLSLLGNLTFVLFIKLAICCILEESVIIKNSSQFDAILKLIWDLIELLDFMWVNGRILLMINFKYFAFSFSWTLRILISSYLFLFFSFQWPIKFKILITNFIEQVFGVLNNVSLRCLLELVFIKWVNQIVHFLCEHNFLVAFLKFLLMKKGISIIEEVSLFASLLF